MQIKGLLRTFAPARACNAEYLATSGGRFSGAGGARTRWRHACRVRGWAIASIRRPGYDRPGFRCIELHCHLQREMLGTGPEGVLGGAFDKQVGQTRWDAWSTVPDTFGRSDESSYSSFNSSARSEFEAGDCWHTWPGWTSAQNPNHRSIAFNWSRR